MEIDLPVPDDIRPAWKGRICGCLLDKSVGLLSFNDGPEGQANRRRKAGAYLLRGFGPPGFGPPVDRTLVGNAISAEDVSP